MFLWGLLRVLDSETKRRIDTARDILVGKIPDPKSQIEQITIALIYKFMDDMDKKSEELGGKAKFFTGAYSKYSWSKLMDASLSGFELVNTYGEAIQSMNQNPNLPQLFRDIFKNAYLPYRDPETLKAFLRIIDDFKYDHSERLGDAFEYLLSVMGSQGDAGQFRTPRHLIEFIVDVVDPSINDTVLDPACGTAGFLISAYKHILEKNMKDGKLDLSPDERKRLVENIVGYDISPDMVRLSLVNLYLHGFKDPHIFEYDTLTSDEKWDETFDVALANPPFMTPKGGIRPHKRFSVSSNRAEVLFVDYMAEHLNVDGKAGIVVPEGIIFQSGTAYKNLRKMLLDGSLYAVVSLPAGVFNPYSGVKTSILFLDKQIAKKTNDILFVKVEADGFNLGAQRREIKNNDLPLALEIIKDYQETILEGKKLLNRKFGIEGFEIGHVVSKDKIKENGYNLSGDRYKEEVVYDGNWDLVDFEKICTLEYGSSLPKRKRKGGLYPVMGSNGISGYHNEYLIKGPAIIVGRKGSAGEVVWEDRNCYPIDTTYYIKLVNDNKTSLKYIYYILKSLNLQNLRNGAGIPGLNRNDIYSKIKIPLPPLEVQERIVEEIENYQNIIDGAKKVVDSYKPSFKIDKDWDVVELGEACKFIDYRGKTPTKTEDGIPLITAKNVKKGFIQDEPREFISPNDFDSWMTRGIPKKGDVLITTEAPLGNVAQIHTTDKIALAQRLITLIPNRTILIDTFLKEILLTDFMQNRLISNQTGSTVYGIKAKTLKTIKIPLPPIETQKEIVARIEEEQKLVDANKKLINLFEKKVKDKIAEVWGE